MLKDSFTIRQGFESSYNAFARNAISIAPFFSRQMVDNCLALPIPAQASRGVLVPLVVDKSSSSSGAVDRMPSYGLTNDGTVGAWSSAFLAANPTYHNGDNIIYLVVRFIANNEVQLSNAYNAVPIIKTITIDTESIETLDEAGWIISDIEGLGDYMTPKGVGLNLSNDALMASDNLLMTVAIGSSKGSDGELLVSSEYFTLSLNARDLYDEFRTESALQAAVNSYGSVWDSPLTV